MGVNDIARVAEIVAAPGGRQGVPVPARRAGTAPPHHPRPHRLREDLRRMLPPMRLYAIPDPRPVPSRPPADVTRNRRPGRRRGPRDHPDRAGHHRLRPRPRRRRLDRRPAGPGRRRPGRLRIRLMYTYPSEVDDRLLEAMARHPKICPYLDIPFQHAHRDVLRRMGRPGDGDAYLRLLECAPRGAGARGAHRAHHRLPGERPAHFDYLRLRSAKPASTRWACSFTWSREGRAGPPPGRQGHLAHRRSAARPAWAAAQQEVPPRALPPGWAVPPLSSSTAILPMPRCAAPGPLPPAGCRRSTASCI